MKNKILFYLSLFILGIHLSSSQVKKGKVIYSVTMESFYENSMGREEVSPKLKKMYRMTADASKNVLLELLFNQKQSIFQHQRGLSISDIDVLDDFVKTLLSKGTFYTNLEESLQLLKSSYEGKDYNVMSEIEKQDWILTKEQKKIGKFLCYKAILDKSNTGLNEDTIAWYAPEIPVSFGPVDYVGNLPGLILELQLPIATYTASKIELNPKKEVKIDWPQDIETMTEEEYKKEGDKVLSKLGRGW